MLEKRNLISKDGNRYVYIDLSGKEHKYFRKEWNRNEDGIADLVMSEFQKKLHANNTTDDVAESSDT
jgi:hypothetical protein